MSDPETDRAASERAAARIRAAAGSVQAPQRLRATVAQQQLAAAPARRARHLRLGFAAATVLTLVALALVLVRPADAPSGGTVADAAQLALAPPTLPPPARRGDGYLRLRSGALLFPDYASADGWRAVGRRTDRVAGRLAETLTYARGGQRIGYTIVAGSPLRVPQGTRDLRYRGLAVSVLEDGAVRSITWKRAGQTCVLATRGATVAQLLEFAAAA